MKRLLLLLCFAAMSFALSGQADTIYISAGQVVKYAPGAKIVTPAGTINVEALGTGEGGLTAEELTDSLSILRDSIAQLRADFDALDAGGGALQTVVVTNNYVITNADAGKLFVKTSEGSDTLIMGEVTLANFTTEFFFSNAGPGEIVIRATISNSFNGVLSDNVIVLDNGLGVAIKTGDNQFLISGKIE